MTLFDLVSLVSDSFDLVSLVSGSDDSAFPGLNSSSSGSLVVGVLGGVFGALSGLAFWTAVCWSKILNFALKSASDKIYEGIDLKTALLYLLNISV